MLANAAALCTDVHAQPSEPNNRKRIARELLAQRGGESLDLDVPGGHGSEAADHSSIDGDVCDADMMAELVLSGVAAKKQVELVVTAMERRTIIVLAKGANLNRHRASTRLVLQSAFSAW